MFSPQTSLENKIENFALVVAPILFGASTFFWVEGEYGIISATLIITSMFFWLPAFARLFSIVSKTLPAYSVWGLWIAYIGCISGVCFAFLGYITSVLNISHSEFLQALNNHPLTSQLLLFATGPIFPLSILVLGVQMLRKRLAPLAISVMLCVAAISFPVSRITRTEWIAHIADIILIIPCVFIGVQGLANYKNH